MLVAQLCLILSDPVDCSPPGSSAHGIRQVRILQWEATPFFRRSSHPGLNLALLHCRQILYHLSHHTQTNIHLTLQQKAPHCLTFFQERAERGNDSEWEKERWFNFSYPGKKYIKASSNDHLWGKT